MVTKDVKQKKTQKFAAGPCPKCGKVYYSSDRRKRREWGKTRRRYSTRYYHTAKAVGAQKIPAMGEVCQVWE